MLSVFKEGGRGPCDEACRWLQDAEKGKEMNYFLVSPQRTQPHCHFDFSPLKPVAVEPETLVY